MQFKNEKSCARSMSDEDLVRAVRCGLTAVGPLIFYSFACTIFNLHVLFLICSNIFNLQVKFLVCSNIFNSHVWRFWATVLLYTFLKILWLQRQPYVNSSYNPFAPRMAKVKNAKFYFLEWSKTNCTMWKNWWRGLIPIDPFMDKMVEKSKVRMRIHPRRPRGSQSGW